MKKTSIIILTYNHLEYTKECIRSIQKYTDSDSYEIIIVDNLSTDGTREWLKKQKNLKVIFNSENLGFPKGCNQGIALADSKNDILLLNNDTIVTTNRLKNLQICLYSDPKIGAVGSICNHNENLQDCDFEYDDFGTMQKLAKKNNRSNPNLWEEKNFLIGFCLLIKREVIHKIGMLDEKYTPGYIEDNDLSLRIIQLGYRLALCHDSFIHHYLGSSFRSDLTKFYPILEKNRQYFKNKWGFSTLAFDEIKDGSIRLLEKPTKILEFDCGIGSTLLKIKYQYKDVVIHGIESNASKREIVSQLAKTFSSLEEVLEYDYDYILIGNILETIENPENLLMKLKKYLRDGGYIIGEIHNTASIQNMLALLNDCWYYRAMNTRNQFTIHDIDLLFSKSGYQNSFLFSWYTTLNTEEQKLLEFLNEKYPKNYDIVSYTFRYQK